MFASMNPIPTPMTRDNHKKIVKLIQTLLGYQQSNIFRRPIPHKSLGWQDYKLIVKKPTDLNFVRRQYGEGKYKSVQEVLDQIQLIWDNVFVYGKKEHESYEMALKMVKHFDELINDLFPEYHEKINRTNYFKQFQPIKAEKKSSNNSNTDKNARKVEKMELQNAKEEVKLDKNLRGSIPTRRRQQLGNNKQQIEQFDNSIRHDIVDNTEKIKKKPESQQKIVQNKKSSSKIHQIDIQEPLKMEQKQQIRPVQTIQPSKKNQNVQNKQPQNSQNPLVNVSEVQAQNKHDNGIQNLSIPPPVQPLDAEDSQQNQFPPITVNLSKTPSSEEVLQITKMMRLLFELHEMQTLSKIVKILTQYEKQNMIIDGEDVNFRMNEIHISTYTRVRKELEDKINQLQQSQKVKDVNRLKEKLNIKLVNGLDSKINQNCADSKIIEEN